VITKLYGVAHGDNSGIGDGVEDFYSVGYNLHPHEALFTSSVFPPPKECGDMWGYGVHPILSNPLKYSSSKILYHDEDFLI
jgi:hypothetical protein